MASVKFTVTLPEAQLRSVRELVEAGAASNVSAFVQHAVALALDDVARWAEMLRQGLAGSGGPLTDEERHWADQVLGVREGKPVTGGVTGGVVLDAGGRSVSSETTGE